MKKKLHALQLLYNLISFIALTIFVLLYLGIEIKGIDRILISNDDYSDFQEMKDILVLRNKIEEHYYSEISENLMLEGAIRGMFLSLPDGYSRYFSKEELELKNRRSQGESIGIGIEIQQKYKQFVITDVIENMPADRAGLEEGDIIISVNEYEMNEDNYSQILNSIRENKKDFFLFGDYSKLKMVIQRNGQLLTFEVERELMIEGSVDFEIRDGLGIVRITRFISTTFDDFNAAIREMNRTNMSGLILDLRGNPGGLVDEAAKIAGMFLGKREILYYTTDLSKEEKPHYSGIDKKISCPVVVLVDDKTASAAEILVGALKSHKAATIIGTTTFGKGIIQTTFTRVNGDGYQITTSEYLTPEKESIHKKGIKPDIDLFSELVTESEEISPDAPTEELTDVPLMKAKELLQP